MLSEQFYYQYHTPFGAISLQLEDDILVRLDFNFDQGRIFCEHDRSSQPYVDALDAYFSGKLKYFNLPLSVKVGTEFQNRVWQQIAAIPYGQTLSYSDIAKNLGSHARAVGQACGRNPIAIIVPCHRVLAKNGLGGFSLGQDEKMLSIKRYLLKLEGAL